MCTKQVDIQCFACVHNYIRKELICLKEVKYLILSIFIAKIFARSKIYAYICIAMLNVTASQSEYTY